PEPFTFEEIRDSPSLKGLEEFFTPQPLILVKPAPALSGQDGSPPDESIVAEPASIVSESTTTVDAEPQSTVAIESISTVGEPEDATVATAGPTVVAGSESTVAADSTTTKSDAQFPPVVGDPASAISVWTAEGIGGVFPSSRRRPIRQAQDVLTHAEEAVYDVLWGKKDQ